MSLWNEVDSYIEKGKTSKQIKVVVNDLIEIRNKMEDLKLTLRNTEKSLNEETEKVKALSAEIESLKQSENAKQQDIQNLQNNLKEKVTLIAQKEEQIKQYQEEIANKESNISALQTELEKIKTDLGERDNQIKSAFSGVTQAEEMLKNKDQQIEQLNSEISQKNIEIEDMKRNLSEGQLNATLIGEKDQEIARLQAELQNTQSQDSKVPALQLKIQTLQSKIQELESTTITRADYDKLFKQNKELEGVISTLNLKVGALSNENERLKEEIAEKIKKINSLTEPHAVMAPSLSKSNTPSTFTSTTQSESLGTSRIVCPHCGSSKITVVEDKSRIISYIPKPVYAKKNVCSQCGFEF